MLLSVISPIYRGEKMLNELVSRISTSVETFTDDYEIILVNDASPDNSWAEIVKACAASAKVKGVNLSRNYGQENAVAAGLAQTKGDFVVVLDCDLQDRPEEIPNLYYKAMEGWDVVLARRIERQDSFLKKLSSTIFHAVFDYLSGINTDKTIGNFGIYCRAIIEAYINIPEQIKSFSSMIQQLGFKTTTIDVEHARRSEGESTYTLGKLLSLAFNTIISNSNKPLQLAVSSGFIMSILSLSIAAYNVLAKVMGLIDVPGYTFTVFSIWFTFGLQLSFFGVLGLYIGKIYDQVKGRPCYVIRETINLDK